MQASYPLRVEADLEPGLSRWLWLVKWFLAIPHFVVLAFLWIAFAVSTVVAFFAILFTGRYPRSVFEFDVGVLRWSWRVSDYAFGVLGTDRYPPFTLAELPGYPAHLEVDYPQRMSRGLVLVKWFLAIPHLVIVGILAGGGSWVAWNVGHGNWAPWGNLIGALVLVAAVALAFTGRYPRSLFDLILGLNRWVLRVAAYVGLMTDRYPPFRLDMGGTDPSTTLTIPGPPEASPGDLPPAPDRPDVGQERRPGWTGGRITSLVIGSVLALVSLGLLAGGGIGLWADQTQRDRAGFITMVRHGYSTGTYALATERIDVGEGPLGIFPVGVLDRVRVRITPNTVGRPVFVGIGRAGDIRRYLAGVGHSVLTDFVHPTSRTVAGGRPPSVPQEQGFWVHSSVGLGTQTVTWHVAPGSWAVVVMNADGSGGVDVQGSVAATVPDLSWIAAGLLAAGLVLMAGAGLLIVLPIRRASTAR